MTVNIDATSGSEAIKIGGVDAVTFDTNGIKTGLGSAFAGAIHGLTLSNGTDADHDIDIAVGGARDAADIYTMNLSSGLTKQIDAGFAAGTNAGGLFSGTVAIDTWYHTFLIKKDSDGTIDAGFDTSVTAANIPAGYTSYKWIGAVLTDGSGNILAFTQSTDNPSFFLFDTAQLDVSGAHATSAVTQTISTPPDIKAKAKLFIGGYGATSVTYFLVSSLNKADEVPTIGLCNTNQTVANTQIASEAEVVTNSSSQIRSRPSSSVTTFIVYTRGWEVDRGTV